MEIDFCRGGRDRAGCVNPQPHNLPGDRPASDIVGTSYEFNFVGAQPGRRRVWAVDGEGREGFESPSRRFVYLQ